VAADNLQAYLWLRLSADGRTGDRLARTLGILETVTARLTPLELATADARAADCRVSGFAACGEPR